MEKWIEFYEPFFPTRDAAARFVAACEATADTTRSPMLMMHQTQRLVSLADEVVKICSRDSLRLLFLVICAENIAKLQDGYGLEGKSKFYTRKFFDQFLSTRDKSQLEMGFVKEDPRGLDRLLGLTEAVDHLYAVRCDVVHEGRYWEFFFSTDGYPHYSISSPVGTKIGYSQLRDMIVRASIAAMRSQLPKTAGGDDAA